MTSNVGGVNCPGVCSASINTGSTIVLTAAPATGSVFAGWTGDCTGTSTCSVLVGTTASAVTATFSPAPQNSLTVTKSGTGTGTVSSTDTNIACGATCSFAYNQGTSVTLNASASAGSSFTGWSGGGCSGTGSCMVTMSSVQLV
ncbi:MAG: InlB B-repeat-containing protein, partial [Terriglobales bacterium]